MEIKWLGTAGFEFKTGGQVFLVDPFLSREKSALFKKGRSGFDIQKTSNIFISHGHFDHIRDVPQIALLTGADIYCSRIAARTLKHQRVASHQIKPVSSDKKKFIFPHYTAQTFFSDHVRFDTRLVLTTLLRIKGQWVKYFRLFQHFPCGQVLSWRFTIEDKIILFFGSAGFPLKQFEKMKDQPVDILMIPLQGHSKACQLGVEYVKYFTPGIVIPHHYDDFYPPLSKAMDIRPFVEKINNDFNRTRVVLPRLNTPLNV